LIFSGTVKERTKKYVVIETSCGLHRIPTNHVVEVSGASEIKQTDNIAGKAVCVLNIDGKFWMRIMEGDKHEGKRRSTD
jgi:hypothetical protein